MAAQFQFVMRSGPNPGKVYQLEASEIVIGRDSSNGVAINDGEISRKHAKLSLHGAAYVIQDLGSTNGTFVNGQRLTGTQVLNPGDSISFGENISAVYEAASDPNATVISSAQAPKTAAPVRKPAAAPAPAPAYSGQVPAGPLPTAAAPAKKKKFPVWLIILIIFVLVICVCVGFFLIIDQFKLWCQVLPFMVPLIGGSC
jgi:predicted component of type VI protein secretion system